MADALDLTGIASPATPGPGPRYEPKVLPPPDPLDAIINRALQSNEYTRETDLTGVASVATAPKGDRLPTEPLDLTGIASVATPGATSTAEQGINTAGRAASRGALESIGSTMRGFAADPLGGLVTAEEWLSPVARVRRMAEDALGVQDPADMAAEAVRPENPQESAVYKAGQAVSDVAKRDDLRAPPGWEQGWTDQIAGAFGSTAPFLVAGATGAGGSLAAGTVLGMWSGAGEAMDRAIAKGATKEQILASARQGNIPGATETLPMEAVFNRIPLPQWGRFAKVFGKVVASVIAEGGQEAGQQAAQNIIAKYNYDPTQEISEGTLQAAALGGIVGGGANVAAQIGERGAPAAPPPVEPATPAGPAPLEGEILPPEAPPPGPAPTGDLDRPTIDLTANQPPSATAPPPSDLQDVAASVWTPERASMFDTDDPDDVLEGGTFEDRARFHSAIKTAALVDDPEANQLSQQDFDAAVRAGVWFQNPQQFGVGPRPQGAPNVEAVQQVPGAERPLPETAVLPALPRPGAEGIPGEPAGIAQEAESAPPAEPLPLAVPVGQPTDLSEVAHVVRGGGSRKAPALLTHAGDLARAEAQVDQNATDAQLDAGNAKVGHLRWQGRQISIENPAGSVRRSTDPANPWEVTMPVPYGRWKGAKGADGEGLDVFIGKNVGAPQAFIIDQVEPETGKYDEGKTFIGFDSIEEARAAYEGSFSDGRGRERIGSISALPVADFKGWMQSGRTKTAYDRKAVAAVRQSRAEIAKRLTSPEAALPKSPILNTIRRMGGVDPKSALAGNLRAMGIKMPGIYRRGGVGSLDNWVLSEHTEFGPEADDGAGYVREDAIMDAIRAEHFGAPVRPAEVRQEIEEHAAANPIGQAEEVALDAALREAELGDDADVRDMARRLIAEGVEVDEAVERAGMSVVKESQTDEENRILAAESEIPFFGEPSEREAVPAGGQVAGPAGAERGPGPQARAPPEPQETGGTGELQSEEGQGLDLTDVASVARPNTRPTASWVIREKATGDVVMETFDRKKVERLLPRYEAIPIQEHLASLNRPQPTEQLSGKRRDKEREYYERMQSKDRATDIGPEGKEQTVIPGAEREANASFLQRKADAPLKPKVAQKDAGALFGDSHKQDELFAGARAVTETPEFQRWFGASKVVDAEGKPLVVYHGASRSDRIVARGKFDPKRATSGPMAFFTEDSEIASKYASGKQDTSLEEVGNYDEWFFVKGLAGHRKPVRLDQAWWRLTPEQRAAVSRQAPRVTRDDYGEKILLGDEEHRSGIGGYDQHLREARGNHLKALIEEWLSSGALFGEEEQFVDVLEKAGLDPQTVEYRNPHATYPGILPVYLSIQKPLKTSSIEPEVIAALERSVKGKRAPQQTQGLDIWHKRARDPREWLQTLKDDLAKGENSHAWSSIPDWVSDTLRSLGYDGIQDTGGKMGGPGHQVWVPFASTQIKSATGNRGTFDPSDPNISHAGARTEGRDVKKITADVLAIVEKMAAPGTATEIVAKITSNNAQSLRASGFKDKKDKKEEEPILGKYDAFRQIITISLQGTEQVPIATHEAWHSVEPLITDDEWKILRREESRLHSVAAHYLGYDNAADVHLSFREKVANASEAYYVGKQAKGVHVAVRRIFDRIARVIRQIRSYLHGQGFRTAEDIFDLFHAGEVRERESDALPGDEEQLHPAWHGTPHRFDKFSTEHIGKGEGAQAYGWGLYFASKKEIAEHYRNKLSRGITINGEQVDADYRDIGEFVKGRPPSDFGLPAAPKLTELPEGYEVGHDSSQESDRRYHVLPPGQVHARPFEGRHPTIEAATKATLDRLNRERQTVEGDVSYHVGMVVMKALDAGDSSKAGLKKAADEYMMNQSAYVDELRQMATIKRAEVGGDEESDKQWADKFLRDSETGAKIAESLDIGKRSGALYRVEIPDEGSYLDWDKPLSEQPEKVKAALEKNWWAHPIDHASQTGEQIYRILSADMGRRHGGKPGWTSTDEHYNDRLASEALHGAGISGIRYLADSGRAPGTLRIIDPSNARTGQWTVGYAPNGPNWYFDTEAEARAKLSEEEAKRGYNFVVFSSDDVQIEEQLASRRNRPIRPPGATFETPQDVRASVSALQWINFTRLRAVLQDRMVWLGKTVNAIEAEHGKLPDALNPALMERIYWGRTGARLRDFRQRDFDAFTALLNARKVSMQQADEYLYALHAGERNAYLRSIGSTKPDPSGMSDKDAQDILDHVKKSGKQADFDAISDMMQDIIHRTRLTLLKSGLLTQEQYDDWSNRYQHYVPLRGFETDIEGESEFGSQGLGGAGINVRGPEAHTAMGRASRSDSPILYAMTQAQRAIIRSEKNRIFLALYRLVDQHPNADVWKVEKGEQRERKITRPIYKVINSMGATVHMESKHADAVKWARSHLNSYSIKKEERTEIEKYFVPPQAIHERHPDGTPKIFGGKNKGKAIFVRIDHPGLARSLAYGGNSTTNSLVRMVAAFGRYQSKINTVYNPNFVLTNLTRDAFTGMLHLSEEEQKGLRRAVAKDMPKAARGMFGHLHGKHDTEWQKIAKDYSMHGGEVVFFDMDQVEGERRRLNAAMARGSSGVMRRAFRWPFEHLDLINGAMENAIRLATYKNLVGRGYSKDQAAKVSRSLTVDFQVKGEAAPILNALYIFAGAATQGQARIVQFAARSPKRFAQSFALMMILGAAFDLLNYWISGDDEKDGMNRWDKLPAYEKQRKLLIMFPGLPGIGPPLLQGYNSFFMMGTMLSAASRHVAGYGGVTWQKAAADVWGSVGQGWLPISGSTPAQFIAPTVVDPIIQHEANESWTGGPLHQDDMAQGKKPNSRTHFRSENPASVQIAQGINRATGGDYTTKGAVDPYPSDIDILTQTVFGGMGTFLYTGIFGNAVKIFKGEPINLRDSPLVRSFTAPIDDNVDRRIYNDLKDAVEYAHWAAADYRKNGDTAKAEKFRAEHQAEFKAYNAFHRADLRIRDFNKQLDAAQTPEAKTAAETRILNEMARARAAFEKARRAQESGGE